jgi:hypothetical protein
VERGTPSHGGRVLMTTWKQAVLQVKMQLFEIKIKTNITYEIQVATASMTLREQEFWGAFWIQVFMYHSILTM